MSFKKYHQNHLYQLDGKYFKHTSAEDKNICKGSSTVILEIIRKFSLTDMMSLVNLLFDYSNSSAEQ